MKKRYLFYGLYIFFAFLAVRKFLFHAGTLGHNWDWSIPVLPSQLRYLYYSSSFLWNEYSLGSPQLWGITCQVFNKLIGLFGYLNIGGDFVSKFLVVSVMVLSASGMYGLLLDILKDKPEYRSREICYSAFIGGFFYGFSPYLFNDFIGGANTQFFTYALFPLTILFFRRYIIEGGGKNLILTGIFLSLISISFQRLFLMLMLLGVYTIFILPNKKSKWVRLLSLGILYLVLNLYWILPLAVEMTYFPVANQVGELGYLEHNITASVPGLTQIFTGTGYFRPFFSFVLRYHRAWTLFVYFIVALVFYTIIKFARKKEPLFWMGTLLFSFILATGGKQPLGGAVLWLYKKIPVMSLFRSPQHLIIIPTFCLAVVLGFGVVFIYRFYLARFRLKLDGLFFVGFLLAIIFWLHPYFIHGDLGSGVLKENFRGGNFVDNYRLSPGYKEVGRILNQENVDFRLLPLPMVTSPYYLKTEYQWDGQGGDPFIISSPVPSVVTDFSSGWRKEFSRLIEEGIVVESQENAVAMLLRIIGVKYILLREDAKPISGSLAKRWRLNNIIEFLHRLEVKEWIRKIYSADYVKLYELKEPLSPIYIPDDIYVVNGAIDGIGELCNFITPEKGAPIFLLPDQQDAGIPSQYASIEPAGNSHSVCVFRDSPEDSSELPEQGEVLTCNGEYLVTAKLSSVATTIEKKIWGWNYKFSNGGIEEWMVKPVNIKWTYNKIPEKAIKITALFDGDDKEDEYMQMRYETLDVDLEEYPCLGLTYRVQDPGVQIVEVVLGLDFNGDGIVDGHTRGVYAKTSINMWAEFNRNFYKVAKGLYPGKEAYRAVTIELYPHKLWRRDCSGYARGYYRFWIDNVGFYKSYSRGPYFRLIRTPMDVEFIENDYPVNVKSSDKFLYMSLLTNNINVNKFPNINFKYKVAPAVKVLECAVYLNRGQGDMAEDIRIPIGAMPLYSEPESFNINLTERLKGKVSLLDNYCLKKIELKVKVPKEHLLEESVIWNVISLKRIQMYREIMVPKMHFTFNKYIIEIGNKKLLFNKSGFSEEHDRENYIIQKRLYLKEGDNTITNLLVDDPNFRCDWVMISPSRAKKMDGNGPEVKFEKINPTRYKVYIDNPKEPFWLILSQSYHPAWSVSVIRPDGKAKKGLISKHYVVNGYANGWWIDENVIKSSNNSDGMFELVLEYTPQRWFFWCSFISGGVLLGVVICSFIKFIFLNFRGTI